MPKETFKNLSDTCRHNTCLSVESDVFLFLNYSQVMSKNLKRPSESLENYYSGPLKKKMGVAQDFRTVLSSHISHQNLCIFIWKMTPVCISYQNTVTQIYYQLTNQLFNLLQCFNLPILRSQTQHSHKWMPYAMWEFCENAAFTR